MDAVVHLGSSLHFFKGVLLESIADLALPNVIVVLNEAILVVASWSDDARVANDDLIRLAGAELVLADLAVGRWNLFAGPELVFSRLNDARTFDWVVLVASGWITLAGFELVIGYFDVITWARVGHIAETGLGVFAEAEIGVARWRGVGGGSMGIIGKADIDAVRWMDVCGADVGVARWSGDDRVGMCVTVGGGIGVGKLVIAVSLAAGGRTVVGEDGRRVNQ